MIVRLLDEGQYELAEADVRELNDLDREAGQAVENGDETALITALGQMAKLVRDRGTQLPEEELAPSEIVVPSADFTLEETRRLMTDQGLIPDLG